MSHNWKLVHDYLTYEYECEKCLVVRSDLYYGNVPNESFTCTRITMVEDGEPDCDQIMVGRIMDE